MRKYFLIVTVCSRASRKHKTFFNSISVSYFDQIFSTAGYCFCRRHRQTMDRREGRKFVDMRKMRRRYQMVIESRRQEAGFDWYWVIDCWNFMENGCHQSWKSYWLVISRPNEQFHFRSDWILEAESVGGKTKVFTCQCHSFIKTAQSFELPM